MINQTFYLNEEKTATLTTYVLDGEISYHVTRNRPAIIICPGGGYLMTATKEGEAVAASFLQKGVNTFVLRYSTYFKTRMTSLDEIPEVDPSSYYPQPVRQLMQVMHLLHLNAEKWHIDVENIFVMGFSAGGHLALSLGNHWQDPSYTKGLPFIPQNDELKPKGLVVGYPLIEGDSAPYIIANATAGELLAQQTDFIYQCLYQTTSPSADQFAAVDQRNWISANTPPTFIWATGGDKIVDPAVTVDYFQRLRKAHVPAELHFFEQGPHGLALANPLYAKSDAEIDDVVAMWRPLAINWLNRQIEEGKDH